MNKPTYEELEEQVELQIQKNMKLVQANSLLEAQNKNMHRRISHQRMELRKLNALQKVQNTSRDFILLSLKDELKVIKDFIFNLRKMS